MGPSEALPQNQDPPSQNNLGDELFELIENEETQSNKDIEMKPEVTNITENTTVPKLSVDQVSDDKAQVLPPKTLTKVSEDKVGILSPKVSIKEKLSEDNQMENLDEVNRQEDHEMEDANQESEARLISMASQLSRSPSYLAYVR